MRRNALLTKAMAGILTAAMVVSSTPVMAMAETVGTAAEQDGSGEDSEEAAEEASEDESEEESGDESKEESGDESEEASEDDSEEKSEDESEENSEDDSEENSGDDSEENPEDDLEEKSENDSEEESEDNSEEESDDGSEEKSESESEEKSEGESEEKSGESSEEASEEETVEAAETVEEDALVTDEQLADLTESMAMAKKLLDAREDRDDEEVPAELTELLDSLEETYADAEELTKEDSEASAADVEAASEELDKRIQELYAYVGEAESEDSLTAALKAVFAVEMGDVSLLSIPDDAETTYVWMNIPYDKFYENEDGIGDTVDAVTSATMNKPGNKGLVAGSYHVTDKSEISGVTCPVEVVPALLEFLQVSGSVVKKDSKDDLFTDDSGYAYAAWKEDEEPSFYKELSFEPGKTELSFSEAKGNSVELKDAGVTFTTESRYGDYQLSVNDSTLSGVDEVYGVLLKTEEGDTYALRHLENIWRKTELAWSTGFTTESHGSPLKSEMYASMMGHTLTEITYYTSSGIYTISLGEDGIYVPVKFKGSLSVEDVYDNVSFVEIEATGIPEEYVRQYSIDGMEGVNFEGDTIIFPTNVSNGKYKLVLSDKNGKYADLTAEFEVKASKLPVATASNGSKLVPADKDYTQADVEAYVKKITSVSVNGKSYAASGRRATVLFNADGTLKTTAAPFAGAKDGIQFEITIKADGYDDLSFTYTRKTTAGYVLMNIPYEEFYAAEGVSHVDAVTSATLNKPRTSGLAGGSYHVNRDGSDITGITYPVYVEDMSVLTASDSNAKPVTDEDSVEITVTNRGQTSTNTYRGKDALFENKSYAYYVLSEAEAPKTGYKKLIVENGKWSFGAVEGVEATASDATATIAYSSGYGDYQITVKGLPKEVTKVYAVTLTAGDRSYGLRHVENIWRMTELAFCAGYTTSVHGCPTSSDPYTELIGQTISKITYVTDAGVYEISANLLVEPKRFVLMNIPYNKFYAGELGRGNKTEVDGVTSATFTKTRAGTLVAGSYHAKADGSSIDGVIYPVLVGDMNWLKGYTEVTDEDSYDITVSLRGKENTITYRGKTALFQKPSYSYYILDSETPAVYKTMSEKNGEFSFSAAAGASKEITTESEITNKARHSEYQINVSGLPEDIGEISGVILGTAKGGSYPLRHLENIWKSPVSGGSIELGFYATSDVTDKGAPALKYEALVGQTISKITFITKEAIYTTGANLLVEAKSDEPDTPDEPKTEITYTITFDAGSATNVTGMPETVSVTNTEGKATLTLSEENTPSRSGYRFLGWATTEDGSVVYAAGDTVELTADSAALTLYPVWQKTSSGHHSGGGSGSSGGSSSGSSGSSAISSGSWQQSADGTWSYRLSDGSSATGWKYISSAAGTRWYHFDSDGSMDTGWYRDGSGNWYYLTESGAAEGAAVTGWLLDPDDGRWYYLDPVSCIMATGWRLINGKWYYFTVIVPEATGWVQNPETGEWEFIGGTVMPLGSMLADTDTPDGYHVLADGSWDGNEKK